MIWEGHRITNRLGIGWDDRDDRMDQWEISGRNETDAATGSAAEMVQLARLILENIPDRNGPPLGSEEESEALPPAAARALGSAVDLALNRTGGLSDEEAVRLGGGLMAAGLYLIRESRPE